MQKKGEGVQPFAEFQIGAHLHTEDSIGDENFDIPFAFGSHIGLGFKFGPRSNTSSCTDSNIFQMLAWVMIISV